MATLKNSFGYRGMGLFLNFYFYSHCSLRPSLCQYQTSQVVMVKNPPADVGDSGLFPALGRSPGGVHGDLFQYSCLENPMDRRVWEATVHRVPKSWTWLKRLSMHTGMSIPHFFDYCNFRSNLWNWEVWASLLFCKIVLARLDHLYFH